MQTIYEGFDVVVRAELDRPSEDLLLTFNARSTTLPKRGFGESFCAKRDIPAVHFLSRRPHWWQTEDMKRAIDAVQSLRSKRSFRSATSYGSSMGAHGALVFSKQLTVDRVIAFSPQFSINGRVVPWMRGWEADTRGIAEIYRMEEELSSSAHIFLLYDPLNFLDNLHATQILRLERNVNVIPVPFAGHGSSMFLQDVGILGNIVTGLAFGRMTPSDARNLIRTGRSGSLAYWIGLQAKAKIGGRQHLASRASLMRDAVVSRMIDSERAVSAARQLAGPVRGQCFALISRRRPDEAIAIARSFVEASKGHPAAHQTFAQVLFKAGDLDQSLHQAQLSLRLDKRNVTTRALFAAILMRQGRYPEAEAQLRICLSLTIANSRFWHGLAASARPFDIAQEIKDELDVRAGLNRPLGVVVT